jgi:hypothetical protein
MKTEYLTLLVLAATLFAIVWQVRIYADMRDHTMVIERAYVTMSHHPPGIIIDSISVESTEDPVRRQDVEVHVGVQNLGSTPANVTRTLLQLLITDQPLPPVPLYAEDEQGETACVFLTKSDQFTIHRSWKMESAGIEEVGKNARKWTMYVIGYIDYIDRFGRRHRAGYGRFYEPGVDKASYYRKVPGRVVPARDEEAFANRNNLYFITQPGYNYDRERQKGEGSDWD